MGGEGVKRKRGRRVDYRLMDGGGNATHHDIGILYGNGRKQRDTLLSVELK